MFGRNWNRIPKPERESIVVANFACLAFHLVGNKNDLATVTTQKLAKTLVSWRDAGLCINQEQGDIGFLDGALRLFTLLPESPASISIRTISAPTNVA